MTRAAIYARYSSDLQKDRSIEDQIALCEAFAAKAGFEVVRHYSDRAMSGASMVERFGLQRLLRDGASGAFEVVVTEDLERLARHQADLHGIRRQLTARRIRVFTAADGEAGTLHFGLKGLMGEMYLEQLAQKTRRGLAGVNRDGRHAGGKVYGYRHLPGKKGELVVDEAEAAIVRRIYTDYVAGRTPRQIAARLNREGVPGPRGGLWNASTLNGSRIRANGVLCNELYVGRIVWNRQSFLKHPDTGKRISRPNPRSEWQVAEAPHLAIVDVDVWERAQAIKAHKGGSHPHKAVRPRHLLSGRLRCGCCSAGYTVIGRGRIGCAGHRERGNCDNSRTLSLRTVEDRVIEGLRTQLGSPELIAEAIREFRRAWNELQAERAGARDALEEELRRLTARINRLVDEIADGLATRATRERLLAAERRREEIEAELAVQTAPVVALHPGAADLYRERLSNLKAVLATADEDSRAQLIDQVRELVDEIVIYPDRTPGGRVDLEIHGSLASFLSVSAEERSEAPCRVKLVAGIGFEPMTFRL